MERYINADALQQKMTQLRLEQSGDMDKINLIWQVQDMILQAPTADVREVVHSEWIQNDNGTWSCKRCHSWIPNEQHEYARYCLYCGADMRDAENDKWGKPVYQGENIPQGNGLP